MIKKTLTKLLRRSHFWRDINFDELSELYISMMFRSLAMSLIGIFLPIYLYDLGYSVLTIFSFYAIYFSTRVVWDFVAGYVVARFGPKHSLAISYCLQIVSLVMISVQGTYWLPLWLIAVFWAVSASIFFVAYHVDFSKIKHSRHSGKELGYMNIMERLGATVGPLVGGVIAAIFGPQYTFMAATIFFMVSLIPMFMSSEAVRTRQAINFRSFSPDGISRELIAATGLHISHTINVVIWPLFIAIVVLSGGVYIKIGGLATLSALTVISVSFLIGRTIDKRAGVSLLRVGVLANAAVHFLRPFVGTFGGAAALNMGQEVTETAIRLPFTKGLYDRADSYPGYRIVYIVIFEAMTSMCKAVLYWLLIIIGGLLPVHMLFTVAFIIAALASSLVLLERFPALRAKSRIL